MHRYDLRNVVSSVRVLGGNLKRAIPVPVAMATTDNSGLANAKSKAAASLMPGSVSMITFFIAHT